MSLGGRIRQYFSQANFKKNKGNPRGGGGRRRGLLRGGIIYSALFKYGHAQFSFEILEYCDKEDVLKREQYYLDILNPEYNILTVAGSFVGYKHSAETIAKMRECRSGRTLEIVERQVKSSPVEVTNNSTGEVKIYPSAGRAAEAIGCSVPSITVKLVNKSLVPIKGLYVVKSADDSERKVFKHSSESREKMSTARAQRATYITP